MELNSLVVKPNEHGGYDVLVNGQALPAVHSLELTAGAQLIPIVKIGLYIEPDELSLAFDSAGIELFKTP